MSCVIEERDSDGRRFLDTGEGEATDGVAADAVTGAAATCVTVRARARTVTVRGDAALFVDRVRKNAAAAPAAARIPIRASSRTTLDLLLRLGPAGVGDGITVVTVSGAVSGDRPANLVLPPDR
jgi:hypothetical protein